MTTWRKELTRALADQREIWADVVTCTLAPAQLDVEFDNGWGRPEGAPFTLWTARRVYFPATHDGKEWVASVARDPDGLPTAHIGRP